MINIIKPIGLHIAPYRQHDIYIGLNNGERLGVSARATLLDNTHVKKLLSNYMVIALLVKQSLPQRATNICSAPVTEFFSYKIPFFSDAKNYAMLI
jgi:hypothetical protein